MILTCISNQESLTTNYLENNSANSETYNVRTQGLNLVCSNGTTETNSHNWKPLEDDTFTDITFDQQGNVFNIKGFNDLLSKYPKLKTMPKHTVDMKEDYNLDLYEQYLNQAISQEKGECGNN